MLTHLGVSFITEAITAGVFEFEKAKEQRTRPNPHQQPPSAVVVPTS